MKPSVTIERNYSADLLVGLLNDIPYDEEIKILRDYWIEFKDCTVSVTGHIHGTFIYEEGDFFTPPCPVQTAQCADLSEIILGYEEITEFLDGGEIGEIEDKLKW